MLLPIESKMEIFAKTYSKDTGVNVLIGDKVCTDGDKRIWVTPIPDQTDQWLRFQTEIFVYHETGHIVTKDVKDKPKDKAKGIIYNAVRDVCIEKHMQEKYSGMKVKWIDFLTQFVKDKTNKSMDDKKVSPFMKLMWALYFKAREVQMNSDFGLKMPDELNEIFQDRLSKYINEVAEHTTIKESLDLTDRIYEELKEEAEKEPEEDQNDSQSGKSDPNDSDDEDKDQDSDGSGNDSEDEDGDQDSGKGSEDEDGDDPSKGSPDKDNGSDSKSSSLSDDAKKELEKAQNDMEDDNLEEQDIGKDIADSLNKYANNNVLYRELPGLKENITPIPERPHWDSTVAYYEQRGREITGHLGQKMKILFVSEKAPRWSRNLRSGRLDTLKLPKLLNQGSLDICKRRTEHIYEDSAVSLVIDNSGSMRAGNKSTIAQSILTSIASDLDKLRIPFEALGFTTGGGDSSSSKNNMGIRDFPIDINIIKTFDEAYRRVRHRFVWPAYNNLTAELPAIQFAVKRIAPRRETKKVLFVLCDGKTEVCNDNLQRAMHQATIEYVERIKKAGLKVVFIGIQDYNVRDYDPEAIIVNDLDTFGNQFYTKLMKILL